MRGGSLSLPAPRRCSDQMKFGRRSQNAVRFRAGPIGASRRPAATRLILGNRSGTVKSAWMRRGSPCARTFRVDRAADDRPTRPRGDVRRIAGPRHRGPRLTSRWFVCQAKVILPRGAWAKHGRTGFSPRSFGGFSRAPVHGPPDTGPLPLVRGCGRDRPGERPRAAPAPTPSPRSRWLPLQRMSTSSWASLRKAIPRWLMAFFSSGDSSAVVRLSPSGTKTGS